MKTPITSQNLKFAFMGLDWTHDYTDVKIGSIMINRHGQSFKVTRIKKDGTGAKNYYSGADCLATHYRGPHNMLTKSPFYAFQFKTLVPDE